MPIEAMTKYEKGAIISFSWGYEQTNIDFFRIIDRKGDWCTLQKLNAARTENSTTSMVGTIVPLDETADEKPIRRKIHRRDGQEIGFAIKRYGWASLWDGEPEHYSSYG